MRNIGCRAGQLLSDVDGCAADGLAESQIAVTTAAAVKPTERRDGVMQCGDIMRSLLLIDRALGRTQISLRRLFAASIITCNFRVARSRLMVMSPQSGASQT